MTVQAEARKSRCRLSWLVVLAFLSCWLVAADTAQATVLPATISENTTLTPAGNPYTGGSTINVGVTVKVEPGVKFNLSKLVVNGTLKAEGTAAEPVVFTGAKRESAGEWSNIKFEPGSGESMLDHVEVAYGGSAANTGAVEVNSSSPRITNTTFRKDKYEGVLAAHGGSPEIAHDIFIANGLLYGTPAIGYWATAAEPGEVNIHDDVVEGGGSGITASDSSPVGAGGNMSGNTVTGTNGTGLSYGGTDIPGNITENTLSGNGSDNIQVSGTIGHSSTWQVGGSPVQFTGTVTVPTGIVLNLQPGIYIRSPKMSVHGILRAEGTTSHPIALTGVSDEKNGEWSGITFESGSGESLLNYVEVAFGGSGGFMLNVKGVSPTITNSTFRRSSSDAIRVQQSGHPIIEGDRFRNNGFGLRYEGEGNLSAPRNDWGCANGPSPYGCGDPVTSNVEWKPAVTLQELPRLCPGSTMLATSNSCLLQKYEPQLRYDSEENYYADSAAEITDNWGDEGGFEGGSSEGRYSNALVDADQEAPVEEEREGLKLAESEPGGGPFQLTMPALGTSYPGGQAADSNDWLEESNEYVRDAHRLEEAGYINAAYAKAFTDGSGKRWLEYWYWYYYNPKSFEGIGAHEGDWESVLVGLDANNRPEEAILSQHTGGSNCYIGEVEKTEEGGPVVYVAVDSHANYPKPGTYDAGFVTDYANGSGPAVQPSLVILGESPPGWLSWPGHWGYTRPGSIPGEATSPEGPSFHGAWIEPDEYVSGASECSRTMEEEFGGSAPVLSATASSGPGIENVDLKGQRPLVSYHVPGADGKGFWPRLRISVNELGDGGIPPTSKTISNLEANGSLTIPVEVRPGHAEEVLGSIVYKNGKRIELDSKIVRSP